MSVKFLVYFSLILIMGACTKTLKYSASTQQSIDTDVKTTVEGTGELEESLLGRYKIIVQDRENFSSTVFGYSQCSEFKMLIVKDKYALYRDSYKLSLACMATFSYSDVMPLLPWENYIRHGVIYNKKFIEKTSVNKWFDIGSDFIFYNFESKGTNGSVNYSSKTLINFTNSGLTIAIYEKDVNGKEKRAVVATGEKITY